MTVLLVAALIEVPAVALVSLYVAHRLLRSHSEVLAAVIGRRARDLEGALTSSEKRIAAAARTGQVARYGPARLKD